MRAAVLGSGSWGTAFAKVLGDAGTDVVMWARRPQVAVTIRDHRHNPDYLPGLRLPDSVTATGDPVAALTHAELVVLAVPAQTLRANLVEWKDFVDREATLVSLMKGIELGTSKRMSEVIVETAGVKPDRVAVVSGPNLAAEIAAEQPTATVVACEDPVRGALVQKAETTRLGVRLGADPLTFAGLAGLGDLVATCSSPLSRNRTFGEHLGRGETLEQAQAATRQTAEGVKSCLAIRDLARKHGIEMPITEQVELVCHEGVDPRVAVAALMSREMKSE